MDKNAFSLFSIDKAFGGELMRDSDQSVIHDVMVFGEKENPQFVFSIREFVQHSGNSTTYSSGNRCIVFPADSAQDAVYRYYDTVWRADQAYYHDYIKPYEQGKEE